MIGGVPIRRKSRHRVHRMRMSDGRAIVLYPIIGQGGKLAEFIQLDATLDSLPITREESRAFLKVR
jgi:hypothetical protein